MHSLQKFLASLAGLILAAGLIALTAGTALAQNRANFDQKTVAKRYNINFFGTGTKSSSIAGVGWFEADEAGNVTSAKFTVVMTGTLVTHRSNFVLEQDGPQNIILKDAGNGFYDLDLLVGNSFENARLFFHVLLDDPRGRSGKFSGSYAFHIKVPTDDAEAGSLAGEITAQ